MKKLLLIMFAVMAFTAHTSAQSADIPSIGFCGNTLYISNGTKYYITPSPFMRKKCIECELLPSCLYMQSCLQKSIEGFSTDCDKNIIQKSIDEDISYKIQRMQ